MTGAKLGTIQCKENWECPVSVEMLEKQVMESTLEFGILLTYHEIPTRFTEYSSDVEIGFS